MTAERQELVSLFRKLEIEMAPPLDAIAQVAHALGHLLQESEPGHPGIRIEATEYVDIARAVEHLTSFLRLAAQQRQLGWEPVKVDANSVQSLIYKIHTAQCRAEGKTLIGVKGGKK